MTKETQPEGIKSPGKIIDSYDLLKTLDFAHKARIEYAILEYHQQFKNPSPDELKQKFAAHLGVKELDTRDGYAVEWTLKELNKK